MDLTSLYNVYHLSRSKECDSRKCLQLHALPDWDDVCCTCSRYYDKSVMKKSYLHSLLIMSQHGKMELCN